MFSNVGFSVCVGGGGLCVCMCRFSAHGGVISQKVQGSARWR